MTADAALGVAVRVIPCLDVDGGRVVKGVNFLALRDAGDPVELAAAYDADGADELVFLDITASSDERQTMREVVARTADQVFIPLTVGGGVRSVADVDRLLRAGADKVSLNTAAIARPGLLTEVAARFGSQCVVISVDARRVAGRDSAFEVTTHGGRRGTGLDAVGWAAKAAELGAGEILLNSMDADGTRAGFDLPLISAVRAVVDVPVIASGGAGQAADFAPAVRAGADAVLAASLFHFGELRISAVKESLRAAGYPVRQTGVTLDRNDPDQGRRAMSTQPDAGLDPRIAARLKRDAAGLVPAIAQQYDTGEVLMLGWMDDEALHRTLTTGRCTYWSRSRREYWVKGDTSGHLQLVKSVALDCDGDTLLVRVDQTGGACHTGDRTCFDADVLLDGRP